MGSSARALKSFAKLFLNIRGLRSAADRLLHDTTVWILIFFAILLASKPLFGSAITCQTPKDWPQSSSEYLHDICYYGARSRTGHVKRFNRGGGRGLGTVNVMTGTAEYYMWVPLITIGYLFLSTVPGFLWKFIGLGCFHGKDLETILDTFYAKRAEKDEGGGDDCFEVGDFVQAKRAKEIEHWIRAKSTSRFGKSRTLIVYIVMKWLQLALLVFQFRSLAFLFGNRNLFWGWNTLRELLSGSYINPFLGEFTLIVGCDVQKMTMGVGRDPMKTFTNVYTAHARCVLGANYLNAKAFLFLYWWFAMCSLVCLCSAVRYTLVLVVPTFRRYLLKSLIMEEGHFLSKIGPPNPDLQLGKRDPLDFLVDFLGNDGFLLVQMIFDIIHYHTGQRTVEALWQLVIVDNSVEIDRFDDEEEKKRTELPEGGELDGRGDAGKDFQHKKPPKTPTNREFETGKLAESLTHLLGSQSSFESHSHGSSSESQDGPLLS